MKSSIVSLFLFLIIQTSFAQNAMNYNSNNYESEWKIIDSLEQQGLPKSALEKTEALLLKAKADNNPSQVIKTLIYRGKYQNQTEENGLTKAIARMEQEVTSAEFPVKQILQSMLGQFYNQYLQNNIWKIKDRTQTLNFKQDDINTWDAEKLSALAADYYRTSLSDERSKGVKIDDFNAITEGGNNDAELRPTLFDFLANRAIEYFQDDRSYLTEPAYKFVLDNPDAFLPAADFVKQKFETKDEQSGKYQTLLLFQRIIGYHLQSGNIKALVDADLARLNFVYNNAPIDNKNDLFLNALQALRVKYEKDDACADVIYALATYYFNKGNEWQPNPENVNKWELRTAYDLCKEAQEKYPNAFGTKNCLTIMQSIGTKTLSIRTEEVALPNKPILSLIEYRNIDAVHLKIIKLSDKISQTITETPYEEQLAYINKLPSINVWKENLPNDGDYHQHSVEAKIDKLPLGTYIVMASDNEGFDQNKGGVSYLTLHISNIAYWSRQDENGQIEFVVTDRTNGNPLKGVVGVFYISQYNAQLRKNEMVKFGNNVTDANGYMYPRITKDQYFSVKFVNGTDTLNPGENYSNYRYRNEKRPYQQTVFFTDRAIYRPGQTIYFKALAIHKDGDGMPSILPNEKITITFKDVNYQEIQKLELTTNEFGTCDGNFTAPTSGLLGQMHIESSIGGNSNFFRVEEYKRPKFEVSFKPIEGSYRLGDKVKVVGLAKAFAGNNIDGAKVKYRVVRMVRFPWIPWYFYRYNPYSRPEMEIINGECSTDANGNFDINFEVIPDKSVPKEQKPEFRYTIYADVTDINGETRSSQTNIGAGYVALSADIEIAEQVNRQNAKPFAIKTENLNGSFERARGTIQIWQLTSPKRTYVNRYWEIPDTSIMDKGEFMRNFPNIPYKDEDRVENWKKEKSVFKDVFDTGMKKELAIDTLRKWEPGNYRLVMKTEDSFGEPIEITKHFTLYDVRDKVIPANNVFWDMIEKSSFEPKDTVRYYLGTAEDKLKVLMEIERKNKIINSQWVDINGLDKIDFQIEEEDRGNIFYHISYVKNNRSYHLSRTLVVPWSNKDLNIEYETFRDKLLPGQQEEWRLKISGKKKDKIAAEMVTAMYDASLDQFAPHGWASTFYPNWYSNRAFQNRTFGPIYGQLLANNWNQYSEAAYRQYRYLNWFGFNFYENPNVYGGMYRGNRIEGMKLSAAAPQMSAKVRGSREQPVETMAYDSVSGGGMKDGDAISNKNEEEPNNPTPPQPPKSEDFGNVKIRSNLNETVFFYPKLKTDADGNIIISFTMNEALTKWKFLGFAHTTDLKYAFTSKEIITQKDLMVIPNPPRFFREGDAIEFSSKVSNISKDSLQGAAVLQLFDALTDQPIDALLENTQPEIAFTAAPGQSAQLLWKLQIPLGKAQVIKYKVIAKSGNYSDGEESILPVLTNRMLVTESLPLPVRGGQTKEFTFKSLQESATSNTLQHQKFTLEFTSNPAWYAVQALPYLMEYPYECTEQIFSRFYANSLASSAANSNPKIKAVFDTWKNYDTSALESNLSKNIALKTALLEETPWVLDAQNEATQKKNIALLFDLNRMANEQKTALDKIAERQLSNGGFAWFPGGRDNWYITQYLVEGFGHLEKLKAMDYQNNAKLNTLLQNAVLYCDQRLLEHYNELLKYSKNNSIKMEDDNLDNMAIHFLYTRSFFAGISMNSDVQVAYNYYLGQADKYWVKKSMYEQGMIALALQRHDNNTTPEKIVASLRERSLNNEEMGMYWKNESGYFWYQMPIETHALMIEVFSDVAKDEKAVDDLKVWLLKNKQTNNWKTTKATSSAVYALLMNGSNWLADDQPINITIGGQVLDQSNINKEAGTGYFKTDWPADKITADMANIKVENPNNVVAWGAVYWQYFEQLDKIKTFKETPLTLDKKLFIETNSDRGPIITPISNSDELKVGDKIKVRIELRVDRDMEYVHLKDMRAASFEPTNVLSQYKWQGGLGYYESTRDAATNFFMDYLPKGTYVFEYPLVVTHRGDFSNGISTIQCMYAPEFSSHSEGVRVSVK